MKITKCMKYRLYYDGKNNGLPYLNKDKNSKEPDFLHAVWALQDEMRQIANRAVQIYWEFSGAQRDYKEKFGCYPDKTKLLSANIKGNIQTEVRDNITKEFYKNNSGNVDALLQLVGKKYKNESKEYLAGTRSIPSYKGNNPIEIKGGEKGGSIRIEELRFNSDKEEIETEETKDENGKKGKVKYHSGTYICKLSLFSMKYADELGLGNRGKQKGMVQFRIVHQRGGADSIIARCASGEYKITSSKLLVEKGKLILSLGYSFESNVNNSFVPGRIMGVDMGIAYPAYMSFNDIPVREKILPGEIEQFRKKVEAEKQSFFAQTKYCGKGRIGHGRKCRMKPVDKYQHRVSNFRDRINHQYSRFIVNTALKNNCGVIQMENLTGIRGDSAFLARWPYYDLQSKIEYKAAEQGIAVVKVNPEFTSQRCSKCGYIDSENRPSQSVFECKKCGFKTNADFNASQNIAKDGIETLIQEDIKAGNASASVIQTYKSRHLRTK